MNFKEWCSKTYGINGFSEGKVVNRLFIPALNKNCELDDWLKTSKAFITIDQNVRGLSLTVKSYRWIEKNLRSNFISLNGKFDSVGFAKFKNNYFKGLGFDFSKNKQFRVPPKIHIRIDDQQAKEKFIKQFEKYEPLQGYDWLNDTPSILMPARFLNHLYESYYRSVDCNTNPHYLQERKTNLEYLLNEFKDKKFMEKWDAAQHLSLDYNNIQHLHEDAACIIYSSSLKLFAELHRDDLSQKDYDALYLMANYLAALNQKKVLQSLLSDSIFILDLSEIYYEMVEQDHNLISNLPKELTELINGTIERNAMDLLHGNKSAELGEHDTFHARPFLPSKDKTDIDELILQGGKTSGHSVIVRLIKLALSADGNHARADEEPHHYAYFKIENNLGALAYGKSSNGTCLGTYITKLNPYFLNDNEFVKADINPATHPKEYQAAMEQTLRELIKSERLLRFYRETSSQNASCYSDPHSEEGKEWLRMHNLNKALSGEPYHEVLKYYSFDQLTKKHHLCQVKNQKGYQQDGGSCTIYSLKGFVDSKLGHELTALHTLLCNKILPMFALKR